MKSNRLFTKVFLLGLGCFLCCLFITQFLQKTSIKARIYSIPIEDRVVIEAFFRRLLLTEPGAYVLFGDKPMAEYYYHYREEPKNYIFSRNHENYQKKLEWTTWRRYRDLFPTKNYQIIEVTNLDENTVEIFLISKSRFLEVFESHKHDFYTCFGNHITGEALLNQFLHGSNPFVNENVRFHFLLGVLFGFGEENSRLFDRLYEITGYKYSNFQGKLCPKKPFNSLEEERQWIEHRLQFSMNETPIRSDLLDFVKPLRFCADPISEESRTLLKKYRAQKREIGEIYQQGDFLEKTLAKITSVEL